MFAAPRRPLSRRVESGSKPETLQHKYADNWLNDARLTDSGLTYRELVLLPVDREWLCVEAESVERAA